MFSLYLLLDIYIFLESPCPAMRSMALKHGDALSISDHIYIFIIYLEFERMVTRKVSYIPGVSESIDKYVRENLQRIGFFPIDSRLSRSSC